jgi:hypothetical protein
VVRAGLCCVTAQHLAALCCVRAQQPAELFAALHMSLSASGPGSGGDGGGRGTQYSTMLPAALLEVQLHNSPAGAMGFALGLCRAGMCAVWDSECCYWHMLQHAHAARPGMVWLSLGVQHAALSLIHAGLGSGKEAGPSWVGCCCTGVMPVGQGSL